MPNEQQGIQYEDWESRQERLKNAGTPQGQAYANAQARVYKYLLKRYREKPPERAFTDAPPPSLPRPDPATKAEAILRRIKLLSPQTDAKVPGGGTEFKSGIGIFPAARGTQPGKDRSDWLAFRAGEARLEELAARAQSIISNSIALPPAKAGESAHLWQNRLWTAILDGIWIAEPECLIAHKISAALDFSPQLPERALDYLFETLNDMRLDLLERCANASVAGRAVECWSARVAGGNLDALTCRLERLFLRPNFVAPALANLALLLSHSNRTVRVETLRLLGHHGTRETLTALDQRLKAHLQSGDPQEAELLVEAMEKIAGRM